MNTKILEELGLTQGEIKTYLALLKVGPQSTGPIAKESQVSRSKLYSILDKLEKKGMVSHSNKNGRLIFQGVEPSKISDLFLQKQEKLESLKKEFAQFLPQLQAQFKEQAKTQQVTVYQGLKGLMTAHEHTYLRLKRGEEFYYLGIPKLQPRSHYAYWLRDHQRRIKTGIRCKLLFNSDSERETLINRNNMKGCIARYMPANIHTPAYFLIYKDTVMIAIPSENPIIVEITSQQITDSFLAYFHSFWKMSIPFK